MAATRKRQRQAVKIMSKLLSKLGGPYFDFLVLPVGQCWQEAGVEFPHLRPEYYHHPGALGVQDAILSVFIQAFVQSCTHFAYYGSTEYVGEDLSRLRRGLVGRIQAVRACCARRQLKPELTGLFSSYCDYDIGDWLPKWRQVRNELVVCGHRVLHLVEQAEREQRALLVLGV